LIKSDSLSHDPNIGALRSIICAVLGKLCWKNDLVINKHGLKQRHIKVNNKLVLRYTTPIFNFTKNRILSRLLALEKN